MKNFTEAQALTLGIALTIVVIAIVLTLAATGSSGAWSGGY